MAERTLININSPETYRSGMTLADDLRKWFQENGTLAFEHGFKAEISRNNEQAHIYMIDCNGVRIHYPKEGKNETISFYHFSQPSLCRIIKLCNQYYNYCLTKA